VTGSSYEGMFYVVRKKKMIHIEKVLKRRMGIESRRPGLWSW
jgi:hypothetical protein